MTWSSKEEVRRVVGAAQAAAKPAPTKPARTKKPSAHERIARVALPADAAEAFASDPGERLDLGAKDLAWFAEYVDATGRNFRTPPPSARYLPLVRRMAVVRDPSIGGKEHWYLVALIDVSQFPEACDAPTLIVHVANLVSDLLARMRVKTMAQSVRGSAAELAIAAKDLARARALVAAHAGWVGSAPAFLAGTAGRFAALARAGLAQFPSDDPHA